MKQKPAKKKAKAKGTRPRACEIMTEVRALRRELERLHTSVIELDIAHQHDRTSLIERLRAHIAVLGKSVRDGLAENESLRRRLGASQAGAANGG